MSEGEKHVDKSTVPNQIPREPEDGEAPKNSALGKKMREKCGKGCSIGNFYRVRV